ncbi:MAG: hypothetical protein N4A33_09960 [Bacteriovoracaceae bacterium]|jgi:hypothetical protein|nr:hypothetical protein [Bacteriovoracaceae bacterium]
MEQMTTETSANTTWIENLALDEINMEESGVINFNEHLNPMALLEDSSIKIMEQLKDKFEACLTKFNQFRGERHNPKLIKIFKISNTVNDFMLYRNSLKLVVARRSADVITIGFLSNSGNLFSARMNYESVASNKVHEIKAHVGAFNEINWKFQGENINMNALVRHYMTEFIKASAK